MRDSLEPQGVYVLDLLGKEVLARRYEPVLCHELEDGALLIDRPTIKDDWSRVEAEWTLVRDDSAKKFRLSMRLYSGRELRDLLLATGFSEVRLCGGLDGRDYGVDAERLVAVARR